MNALSRIRSGIAAVIVHNDHPENVGALVYVHEPYTGVPPSFAEPSVRWWVIEATMPMVSSRPALDGSGAASLMLTRIGAHMLAREEDLLAVRRGPVGEPYQWHDRTAHKHNATPPSQGNASESPLASGRATSSGELPNRAGKAWVELTREAAAKIEQALHDRAGADSKAKHRLH